MGAFASIFFDIDLPNPTTWFYFSGLLAVALFFKFSRVFSMRNLDVLTLYLFSPGLLLLVDDHLSFWGYLWLILACVYFLIRCLLDLALVRRPALGSNLDFAGLAWLGGALFVSLVAVAARQPDRRQATYDPGTPADQVRRIGERAIEPYAPADVDTSLLRVWVERSLAILCHLSVVVGLVLIGWRHFDDIQAGMSAATFYLLLPYTFLLVPDSPVGIGRWDHAWPMALVVWTIFTYRRPVLAGAFLGLATGTSVFLLFILPAWLSFYRHRGANRFLISFLLFTALGLAVLGALLYFYDGELPRGVHADWLRLDWLRWKDSQVETPGIWRNVRTSTDPEKLFYVRFFYRVPIFIASLALVVTSAFWPNPKSLAHVLALSAAALLSIQLWYADRGGSFILWFLPLLLLLVFRPNLSNCQPPLPSPNDWLARLVRPVSDALRRIVWSRPAVVVGPSDKPNHS
jgi:hypothetical protein